MTSTPNSRSSVYLGEEIRYDRNTKAELRTGTIINFTRDEHVLLIGPTRSGKGRRLIIPNLILDTQRSALVVDPKGELAFHTAGYREAQGHNVIFLDPFGELAKSYPQLKAPNGFNPLLALNPNSPDFVDDAMGIAEALVLVDTHDPHWTTSAQDLIAGLVMCECVEQKADANLGSVRKTLTLSVNDLAQSVTKICENPPHELVPNKLEKYRNAKESRELASVISTAQTETRFLDSPLVATSLSQGNINFASMKEQKITIYLVIPPSRLITHAKWLRLVIGATIRGLQQTKRHESNPDVMLILDEFPQLGRMESIETSMALNAGYGIKIFAVVQHLGQLQHQYQDNWQTFLSGGVIASFAPRDKLTSEHLTDLVGQELTETVSTSISKEGISQTTNKQMLPVMYPHELRRMAEGNLLIFLPTSQGQRIRRTFAPDFSEMPEISRHVRT